VLRLWIAMFAGRLAGRVSQMFGRGGSAVPGLIAERIDPRLIETLAGSIPDIVVVSGTNGKTTTTKLLVGILEASGVPVLTNPTGSNLARGIATRLIQAASWRGIVDADIAVLEVDEAAMRGLGPRLAPSVVVVTNLARDQLDRYGELNTTAAHIGSALEYAGTAVLNADDPLVAGLAGTARTDRFFGGSAAVRAAMPDDRSLYGDRGEERAGPSPDLVVEEASPAGDGRRVRLSGWEEISLDLRLPGVYNAYNAAAALLAGHTLGVPTGTAVAAVEAAVPAWGRGQVIDYSGRQVRLLLVKNPAGFNQAIRLLGDMAPGTAVMIAINDNIADGRDVSWLWDARVEDLAPTGHRFVTSGIRALDMAVRLKYAGIEAAWAEPSLPAALQRFVDDVPEGADAYIVPTYTAMLDLLRLLLPDTRRREAWT
jgi:UDP-N-acetylmuramyl tripeptide synthase